MVEGGLAVKTHSLCSPPCMRRIVLYHDFHAARQAGQWANWIRRQESGHEGRMSNVVAMPREQVRPSIRPKMLVAGATKYYQTKSGAVHALEDVSIEVREGEFLC